MVFQFRNWVTSVAVDADVRISSRRILILPFLTTLLIMVIADLLISWPELNVCLMIFCGCHLT